MDLKHEQENALGHAASAYLRSARHQPIAWNEWGAAAFARAAVENKPVLLDIGAVWCHWCHVMDRESYENPETAALINERFVAVKVDRDERPDVDARYQAAVSAISGQGGWPLTAFLTPDGKPYFGGTYFPPDERYGRPSFQRVLRTMADAFADKREDVEDSAGSVMRAIEHNEAFSGRGGGLETGLGAGLLEKLIESAVKQFDERNGGFGSQPKFPHPGALDLLIDAVGRDRATPPMDDGTVHEWGTRKVATVTLMKMASGGIYDQLAGGFHRYSVDERWVVPHFEKMAYDNSELLKNYAHAYSTFGEKQYADVAADILRWMDAWLSDRELGGFYASQDADDSLEDDGDYFTWTRAEAEAVLTREEFFVAEAFYNLRAVGDMHHNPLKNVLHRVATIDQIAKVLKLEVAEASELMRSAKDKMYAARLERKTPYVDKTVYTGWNGMCIAAYLQAGRALGAAEPVAFALKSLNRVLAEAWDSELGLAHVVAYGEGVPAQQRVAGVLEDYAFVANAALDAWEATGELRYYAAARVIGDTMLLRFCDSEAGDAMSRGFFDTEKDAVTIGALSAQRKPLQDAPTPSGNAVAATLLLRLYALTGDGLYRTRAQDTLETFAGIVEHFGLYAASYGLALRGAVEGATMVCVIGDDALADELAAAALTPFAVEKSVVRLTRDQLGALPPALAETLPHLPGGAGSVAVVCCGNTCLPPVGSVEELRAVLV
jgi:uncharacterized protein YyaL (SSP411 family)